jgi:starvation-inducible DNA-binding protein
MNYLGFKKSAVISVVGDLNTLLSNYNIYYQNLRNFHWNIQGENFFDLHNKFEEMYQDARAKIDDIAERILVLRHRPLSRFTDYIKIATIPEAILVDNDEKMVFTILENHKILISNLREILRKASDVNDEGTVNMASGFLKEIEKKSWMLDAWATRKSKFAQM